MLLRQHGADVTVTGADRLLAACQDAGVAVQAVDAMTLEEIFIANVQSRREGVVA